MNTKEGKLETVLQVKTFTLRLNDDVSLHNMAPFLIRVCFEYWAETHSKDFEEPSSPEYIELLKVCTINDLYLTDGRGIMVHISPYGKFMDLLTEGNYSRITDALSLKQDEVML
jgi:hypothetical protein